ncbi:MAG: hypothetical protein IT464_04915 [Planctomycetes bacterium]|nr:hypothetical protein [Planctomycetota bacterium]
MPRVFRSNVFSNKKEHWSHGLASEVYRDGTFELVPIDNRYAPADMSVDTYQDIPSWHKPTKSLAKYLGMSKEVASWTAHDDPDLHTEMAYGGTWTPRDRVLFSKARPGDFLLFIAHLAFASEPGRPEPDHRKSGWYLVGCLAIEDINIAGPGERHSSKHRGHAHAQIADYWGGVPDYMDRSVIVQGRRDRLEQRFQSAVPLLTEAECRKLVRDKSGQPPTFTTGTSIKERMVHFTRTGRCIGDTDIEADLSYLKTLKDAIVELNPGTRKLLW